MVSVTNSNCTLYGLYLHTLSLGFAKRCISAIYSIQNIHFIIFYWIMETYLACRTHYDSSELTKSPLLGFYPQFCSALFFLVFVICQELSKCPTAPHQKFKFLPKKVNRLLQKSSDALSRHWINHGYWRLQLILLLTLFSER